MTDIGFCDFCGAPVGFYGCPKHGTDCYDDEDKPPDASTGQKHLGHNTVER